MQIASIVPTINIELSSYHVFEESFLDFSNLWSCSLGLTQVSLTFLVNMWLKMCSR